jgi:hypothetical protein
VKLFSKKGQKKGIGECVFIVNDLVGRLHTIWTRVLFLDFNIKRIQEYYLLPHLTRTKTFCNEDEG